MLIPNTTLLNAKRMLYMTHLALGDFVFQGMYLRALKKKYPSLHIDVWIDDCRDRPKAWAGGRNSALTQWLESVPFVEEIYPIVASSEEREQLIQQAKQCDYDIVVCIATTRTNKYAEIVQNIGQDAFTVATRPSSWVSQLLHWHQFKKINAILDLNDDHNKHISAIYRSRFESIFGTLMLEKEDLYGLRLSVPESKKEAIETSIANRFTHIGPERYTALKKVFINHLSTTEKRDYTWDQVVEVMKGIEAKQPNTVFVLNVPPNALDNTHSQLQRALANSSIKAIAFSAVNDFFELPAMLEACDLVITVETAIMHIAASMDKQQVVLMRESAAAWTPLRAQCILRAERRVDEISARDVVMACTPLLSKL
ncbi:hypothetical protein OE749_15800 [Aestuariibacter sp. AA17]|uniref:ADP-heptose:LPS heptosyltransferase n=1 Tax=Fluctibacter corallii TaxID=2984329 RepID=A0ABT3AC39_9ALTE|nr:glycosyltransferase family 9 protein [Aestuariibacter sp. AA17]MCV2886157.1 hypothetical protein [Aestuariibacter sp. AA17]